MTDARITTRRRLFASARELVRLVDKAERGKKRNAELRGAKKCINTSARRPRHGKPYRGGRCRACWKRKLAAERGEGGER